MINVLVIDNSTGCSRSIRKAIPTAGINGFKIDFKTSSRGLLKDFRRHHYDVCVVDAPSNGSQLYSHLRSLGYAIPVVLVTSDDAREVATAMRSGVADCLLREDLTAAGFERTICSVVEEARALIEQRERECRYRALMDNAADLICTHDLDGNLTSMNFPCEQLLGYSRDEWSKLAMAEIVDREYQARTQEVIQQTMDTRSKTFSRLVMVTKCGQKISVEANSHLIYDAGRAVEIQWIARELNPDSRAVKEILDSAPLYAPNRTIQGMTA